MITFFVSKHQSILTSQHPGTIQRIHAEQLPFFLIYPVIDLYMKNVLNLKEIGVIGAGAWGTALANLLADNGVDSVVNQKQPQQQGGHGHNRMH